MKVVDKIKGTDKALWAKKDLADPTAWMRWFDFFPLYNAASEGASFVENNQFTANEAAMTDVFGLMHTLADAKVLRTGEATDPLKTAIVL